MTTWRCAGLVITFSEVLHLVRNNAWVACFLVLFYEEYEPASSCVGTHHAACRDGHTAHFSFFETGRT